MIVSISELRVLLLRGGMQLIPDAHPTQGFNLRIESLVIESMSGWRKCDVGGLNSFNLRIESLVIESLNTL